MFKMKQALSYTFSIIDFISELITKDLLIFTTLSF
jgi:hypothetical protein